MERKSSRVCVTGATGYIGSWLCKKLLEKGHTVHATLRNLGDASKVGVLKSLPKAETNLVLFEADLYKAEDFQAAIHGCDFVFHVAHPMPTPPAATHATQYQDTNLWDATVEAMKSILRCCMSSGTVKRLICTGSVVSTSPLKEDDTGFKPVLDESCWTPLNLSFPHCSDLMQAYTYSKTLSEKEALRYEKSRALKNGRLELEVVSLACGLVGGDTILGHLPFSTAMMISPVTAKLDFFKKLMFLQGMLGSVPLLHIEDACEAHLFCMEQSTMSGRFLCASSYPTLADITRYYKEEHNQLQAGGCLHIPQEKECEEGHGREVQCGSTKLTDIGFQYKYNMKMTLDDNMDCARKLGAL